MTLPESPAVQDTDRLREVAEVCAWRHYGRRVASVAAPERAFWQATCACGRKSAPMDGRDAADAEHSAHLAAELSAEVLPVHREMVLAEVAHELGRRATTVPWSDPTLKRGIQYAASVVSVLARDSATSPPPGSPPADERATAGETGRVGRFEELLAAEHEQFDPRGEVLRSLVEYADAPTLAVSAPAAAAVPGTGDDLWRRRIDVSTIYGYELGAGDLAGVEAELVEARRERDEARAERNRLTETNARLEVERDDALALVAACTTRQQRRLAETIRRYEPVIEAAKAWRVWLADELDNDTAETNLAVAVEALGDIPSPTAPEASAIRTVPLDEVLRAVRDDRAVEAWAGQFGSSMDGCYIESSDRERLALYLTERFAPAEPEGTPDA